MRETLQQIDFCIQSHSLMISREIYMTLSNWREI
jgi:hypothetical protein